MQRSRVGRSGVSERYAILTEGFLADIHGKTAHGILRYRPELAAVVIDSRYAGRRVRDVVASLESDVSIVKSVRDALAYEPRTLLVGVATDGGAIAPALRRPILDAIDAGLNVVSGLHELINEDAEIADRARHNGVRLVDVRVPPAHIPLFSGAAYQERRPIVLGVGSDCAVGKMTAMLEIERAARALGRGAEFIATGQTGILITGKGIAVDRVIADFITGAAEQLVRSADSDAEMLLIEGQGSIFHPAYAPVALGLLYGCSPDALLLCHRPGLPTIQGFTQTIPDLRTLVEMHERVISFVKPARVLAIALDTSALSEREADEAIRSAEEATGLAADDPVRNSGAKLWRALEGLAAPR